ncbi:hypothetical protein CK203_110306 [Vitis vinifera]|uniref:Uncharacterized protein n=1 Tax=Vitis vinifera TaxID=29760 RepID=A0A438DGD3_VITVI|nr:hypothetical protein CK203_110306 [Vitis vinifera]
MVTAPPIEGDLDCRARPFHSEFYFNIEAMQQQLELWDSFGLLQRAPRVPPPFISALMGARAVVPYISARHGPHPIQGTSGDLFLLHKELPSGMLLVDVLLWSNIFPLQHLVQRRGAILNALFRISEGFYFGSHHLIMVAFLYFEEKVHRKKLQGADTIPLLFLRLLCHILEHIGYPTEPHLERRHHCREHFTLDQWT